MVKLSKKTQAIIDLQMRGFDQDFIIDRENIVWAQENQIIRPQDLEICERYYFDENPGIEANYYLYALHSSQLNLKGILLFSVISSMEGMVIDLSSLRAKETTKAKKQLNL